MSLIEPVRQDINHPGHVKRNSSAIRFWHWANTLIISGSLLTVLVNSTMLDPHSNADYIQKQLQQAGAAINTQQANQVSHGLEDKVWGVHIYFGYFLAALLLFRLVMELFQPAGQKFAGKLKAAYRDYFVTGHEKKLARHELVVKLLYAVFYVVLALIILSGLTLAFNHQLGLSKVTSHRVKEFHGFLMYLVIAFIIVHIMGVVLAERNSSKGIVSDMINGGSQ